jgi:hypothetical protein
MAYSELLKDPRWQRKRLEIMQRDGYTCKRCGDSKNTLHVHHLIYRRGLKPWEHSGDELVTLCIDCHEDIENAYKDPELWLARMRVLGIHTDRVLGFIISELAESAKLMEGFIENRDVALGVCQRYGIAPELLLRERYDDGYVDFKTFFIKRKINSRWKSFSKEPK